MTRQQEWTALLEELQTVPPALAGTAKRAKARAARRRFGVSLGSLAAVAAAFVIVVNAMPTFALACGNIPILRELAAAVAFSPSLSEAVRHDYVQYVGKSQTVDGVTVTLETVIADQQQLVGFYRTDLAAETSATCNLLGEGIPSYFTTGSYSGEALRSFTVHLQDGALPETFTLSLQLTASDAEQERFEVEGSFDFDLHLDPEKTSASVTVEVGKEAVLDGQTLRVEQVVFTPTRTTLHLSGNPGNTASLEALTFHFTAPDGTAYGAVDGSISAMGTAGEAGFYTYYCQSLFFLEDPTALTLVLEDALWCAKDAAPITVDLNDGSYAGALPAGVTALWVEKNRGTPVVMVETVISQMPFTSYLGEKGVESLLLQGGVSQTDEADGRRYEYVLEGYEGDAIALIPDYTQETVLDPPLEISLDA